jgi:hypothetical protein
MDTAVECLRGAAQNTLTHDVMVVARRLQHPRFSHQRLQQRRSLSAGVGLLM